MASLKFVKAGGLLDLVWPAAVPALAGIGVLTGILPIKLGGAVMIAYAIIIVATLWHTERRRCTALDRVYRQTAHENETDPEHGPPRG